MKKVARRIRAGQSEQDEDHANRIDLQLLSWGGIGHCGLDGSQSAPSGSFLV